MAAYAPNLKASILARQVLTPVDLEEIYGVTGGHVFHGETTLDQVFTMRPLLDWAQYRTPVRRLYLCGAGTHPVLASRCPRRQRGARGDRGPEEGALVGSRKSEVSGSA